MCSLIVVFYVFWLLQIGARFWDKVYQEHSKYNKLVLYDEPTSTFFRNVDIS